MTWNHLVFINQHVNTLQKNQIVKIISDNQFESIDFKNKEVVYNIIFNHRKLINELCIFYVKFKKILSN